MEDKNDDFVLSIRPIARIKSDFKEKFGIPRQPGLVPELVSELIFEEAYKDINAVRGLDKFSHLWIIWGFSENFEKKKHPTVRPPKLGGNIRMGVFATRSPVRPNNLGLSCVRLLGVEEDKDGGKKLLLGGGDMLDGSPVYDIKPYIRYSDSVPQAKQPTPEAPALPRLKVKIDEAELSKIPHEKRSALIKLLELDPRPGYKAGKENDMDKNESIYGLVFSGFQIKFTVSGSVLRVVSVVQLLV